MKPREIGIKPFFRVFDKSYCSEKGKIFPKNDTFFGVMQHEMQHEKGLKSRGFLAVGRRFATQNKKSP